MSLHFLLGLLGLLSLGSSVEGGFVRDIRPVIKSNGYPVETHATVTEDGFTLNVVRIPYGKKNATAAGNRPPIFLQHGLVDSCATWLIGTPEQALGYILADAGFDVWLGNIRGTSYSPPPGDNWGWSWNEMSKYDLPAMIELALNVSNAKSLTYIGHSQGTMMKFGDTDPVVSDRINAFIALAPVAFLSHTTAPLVKTISEFPKLGWLIQFLNLQEFDVKTIPHLACKYIPVLCDITICTVAGCEGGITKQMTEMLADHFPDFTSWQNLLSYAQAIDDGKFRRFDYGSPKKNVAHYGTPVPPEYSFGQWRTKSFLFYGGRDTLADRTDVEKLLAVLPKDLTQSYYFPNYGHSSFVWNEDAQKELYPKVIEIAFAAVGW